MGVATSRTAKTINLFDTTIGKVVKTAMFLGASAAITYVIKVLGDLDWGTFAALQPIVNAVLVGAKNFFDKNVPNLP